MSVLLIIWLPVKLHRSWATATNPANHYITKGYLHVSVCAVQMVCDVLDLHEMMETMRRESKRLSCQILKDKEKVGYPSQTP